MSYISFIGALTGATVFLFAGREPAQRLVDVVRRKLRRGSNWGRPS
jgi:hypothetical protein